LRRNLLLRIFFYCVYKVPLLFLCLLIPHHTIGRRSLFTPSHTYWLIFIEAPPHKKDSANMVMGRGGVVGAVFAFFLVSLFIPDVHGGFRFTAQEDDNLTANFDPVPEGWYVIDLKDLHK
jgi:hypothetical protein